MTNTPAPASLSKTIGASWRGWMDIDAPPGSIWVQLAWTAVWAAGFALVFTIIGFVLTARSAADWLDLHAWALWFGRDYVVAGIISLAIQGLFRAIFALFGTAWVAALAGWQRSVFFSAVPLLGTAIGWPIGMALIYGRLRLLSVVTSGTVVSLVVVSLLMSALFHVYFSLRHKELKARMRANEAQLRLLQGQMEPHFLFNTLATVISLVDADPPRAKHMLEALTDYLRASLGSLRHEGSTVGLELDLATRYLELMRSRMGERLRFELDAAPDVRGAALAPLLLQPLIENAVKHGLEPQVDGGLVRVSAHRVREDGRDLLRICVDDDGAGLAAAPARKDGNGIALHNLRERLQGRFGAAASLTLATLPAPGGTRSCLTLPWQDAAKA